MAGESGRERTQTTRSVRLSPRLGVTLTESRPQRTWRLRSRVDRYDVGLLKDLIGRCELPETPEREDPRPDRSVKDDRRKPPDLLEERTERPHGRTVGGQGGSAEGSQGGGADCGFDERSRG